jgi:hypothetical protein
MLSQGGDEDGQWHNHAKAGKWHDLEHECPKCKMGSVFDWNNYQFEKIIDANEELDWVAIYETVRLKCPHCGEQFQDTEYNRRQWAKCKPVWDGGKFIPGRMTLRASFMTVWRYSWCDMVKEWLIANEDKKSGQLEKLENIICQRFAQFWKKPSESPVLSISGEAYSKKEYHEGLKWELEHKRFLTVDVQGTHFWCVIRAWQVGGESRLLWEGRVETWDNIRYLQERYGVENWNVAVDCGYRPGEAAEEAMRAAKPGDTNTWVLLRGEDTRDGYVKNINGRNFRRMFSDYRKSEDSKFKTYKFVGFSNLLAKDFLCALMQSGKFGVPVDVSKNYHAHMQSEQKRETSPGIWRWEPIKKGRPNHLWDCEVEQAVMAHIRRVFVSATEVK